MPRRAPPRSSDLLSEILLAPDRDRMAFARPVVSWTDRDEDAYLAAIEACALASIRLERRGRDHGDWAELDPARLPVPWPAAPERGSRAFDLACAERWHAARPIVLPGIAGELLEEFAPEIADAGLLHEALCERGGLADWYAGRAPELEPRFEARADRTKLADPERDLERITIQALPPSGAGPRVRDLWIKSAWLSTHADDRSLRVRVGHGREGADDADGDLLRHTLVAELASELFPESAVAAANPALVQLVERLAGEDVLFTQHIAYWNAPGGGALFHHDAFAEDDLEDGAWRQLGVCYVQLSGATAWLALSTDDLMARVVEFVEMLEDGDMPWVRAQLFEIPKDPVAGGWKRLKALLADTDRLRRELSRPGCGVLGPLVERAPEFTSFLADAGHGCVLRAGDAILLPNFGLSKTCMHSVFCAGDEVGYSLSMAMRRAQPVTTPSEAQAARAARAVRNAERNAARRELRGSRGNGQTRSRGARP